MFKLMEKQWELFRADFLLIIVWIVIAFANTAFMVDEILKDYPLNTIIVSAAFVFASICFISCELIEVKRKWNTRVLLAKKREEIELKNDIRNDDRY